jgi:hypothetical protein
MGLSASRMGSVHGDRERSYAGQSMVAGGWHNETSLRDVESIPLPSYRMQSSICQKGQ